MGAAGQALAADPAALRLSFGRMKAIITGSHGTLGAPLSATLEQRGWSVIGWDRAALAIDDYAAMDEFVAGERPDALFHLAAASQPVGPQVGPEQAWRVNYEWTSELAWICRQRGVPFVFTSTVMVFTDAAPGPYTIASSPNAEHDYGMHKRRAEERVFAQNPEARVVRLGWQIGEDLRGNQMAAWLAERSSGPIEASLRWIPACSFIDDTVAALIELAGRGPGLYQIDGNEGWSFYDLAWALKARHRADWAIVPSFAWAYDQRMLDPRIELPSLAERLPELRRR